MSWEPLNLILYGYAVHPLQSARRDNRISSRNPRLSTVTEISTDEQVHRDVVNLEVGDEVYAFEKYTPRGKEVDGEWYRGYVVCTTPRPNVVWSLSADSSTSTAKVPKNDDTQVFIGIFPASHIFVRDKLPDAEGRLPELAAQLHQNGAPAPDPNGQESGSVPSSGMASPAGSFVHWNGTRPGLGSIREPPDNDDTRSIALSRRSFRLGPTPDQASSSRAGYQVYTSSLRSVSPSIFSAQLEKQLPPRPSLKSGDDTASGSEQPIVDEISSALREWHTLMFQYLARRDYKRFHVVREHIEALHLGRRQLLAKTLSAEETTSMLRDCVMKLVSGNIVQGLDVIVRHPLSGGLVTVDGQGGAAPRTWVSAVRMYAMQTALAYLNVSFEEGASSRLYIGGSSDYLSAPVATTPAHSAFPVLPEPTHRKSRSRSIGSLAPPGSLNGDHQDYQGENSNIATKFYHVYLDVRAFVATPCSPGETAELFFSLYKKQGTQFVTEEFCAILNHQGVLARDPSARIKTLFTDLAQGDIQDPVYLVCRIVRNGALKLGSRPGSERRGSEHSFRVDGGPPSATFDADGVYGQPNSPVSPNRVASEPAAHLRRPFGCAVLELTQLAKMVSDKADVSPLREFTMPIFVPSNEASFSTMHQNIISGNFKEFEKSTRADSIAVSIKIFRGTASTVVRENMSLLQDAPHTLRLGFPDVVFPGDVRNELYIKLWSGDFTSSHNTGGRLSVANLRGSVGTAGNNIQVSIEVRDQDGRTVSSCISQGSGEPLMTQFNSMVFQRYNEPTFGELIKVQLPLEGMPHWHLFFTFRNRSGRERTKGSGDPNERPFAFAFLPLVPDQKTFMEDGSHTLVMYRADKVSQLHPSVYLNAPSELIPGQRPEQLPVQPEFMKVAPLLRDSLTIRSSLCSTRYTQNAVLLSLLNWEKIGDRELLSTILRKFTFVGEGEIVKFLRDIFDALFGILISVNDQSGEMDLLVFNALVTVLGIVQDRRFSNFQPVLDVYIERHFDCAAASSRIIHAMNRLLANPTASETASPLLSALKVWHYIFKFITRSRELAKAKEMGLGGGATAEHLETTFKRELRSHLSEVNRMMSMPSPPSIIGTQTIALQHFTSVLPELAKIFSTVELVSIATTFANAVAAGKGKIVIWKLIMYLQIVKGFLFDNPQSRPLLVETVVIWIKPHFGRYDEYPSANEPESVRDGNRVGWLESIRLCVTIIAVMLDKLQENLVSEDILADRQALKQERDNVEYLLQLLPKLLESYREFSSAPSKRAMERTRAFATLRSQIPVTFPESYPFSLLADPPDVPRGLQTPTLFQNETAFNPGLGETAIVLLALILSSPTEHVLEFLNNILDFEGKERLIGLLSQFFAVGTSILDNEAFPKTWLNINILAHKVLIKMMEPVATIMEKQFIPEPESQSQFDAHLWREGFYMLLKLLSSDQLVIEEFSPQKRRAVWRLAGDIRGEGAAVMLNLWQALGWAEQLSPNGVHTTRYGGYQVFLNTLVGHVVNLCLSHHDQLRNNAVQILFSMIVSEYHQHDHFDDIENELVTRLDSLFMSDSKGDDISRAFFISHLRHLFESSDVDEQLRERVSSFLDSVDLFLELLLSVRALPEGEEYADDRVIATLRLMNFIRRIGRDEIYIKYVHQLVNMHISSQNFVEAALTLKLHADLHVWDLNSFLPPMEDLGLPQQSQFNRKETLCFLILDYLGKGKAWERAIEICKELAYQHGEVTFNYARLSEILRHQAALLSHIVTDQRYYPDYYRVTFYGNFPGAIRDKRFIYRGYEWEKFGAFCERMLNKHPGAQLLKSSGDPPVDVRFGQDQYIQCTAVTPEPDRTLPIFTNPDVPLPIRTYYEHSDVSIFSSSRQIRKSARDGSEEVWVEKTYFTTEEAFPTVLRRSEVIAVEVVEISPIENALTEVENKTKELTALHLRYQALAKTAQPVSTNALAMSLNSAVDAPHNTGVSSYRQLYFNPDYVARNPERRELIDKLRAAIDDQVRVIESCLKLHGQLCPPEFIPFHDTLEKFFRKNFREEMRRLDMDLSESPGAVSPSRSNGNLTSQYHLSALSNVRDERNPPPLTIPPLQLGRPGLMSPPSSPRSPAGIHHLSETPSTAKTPLQRQIAHLAKHGINAVASAPGENIAGGSDSVSINESTHNSLVNVVNGGNGLNSGSVNNVPTAPMHSAPSVTTSNIGSSLGSLKGRFSSLGSLNFGRKKPASTINSNS